MHPLVQIAMVNNQALYQWGANFEYVPRIVSIGADCSGWMLKNLHDYGLTLPDMTAQMIHHWCVKNNKKLSTQEGSLLFFGFGEKMIDHVALSLGNGYMIECGGAGSDSLRMTKEDLITRDARVRIRKISSRKDFIKGLLI